MKNKLLLPLLAAVLLLLGGLWFWTEAGAESPDAVMAEGIGLSIRPGEGGSTELPDARQPERGLARTDSAPALAEVLPAKEGKARVAIPSNAIWVTGHVIFPEGMPNDAGKVTVTARGRAFGESSRREYTATADRNGEFRVAFANDTRTGWLDVESRYLYMQEKLAIKPRVDMEPVQLEPEMGGIIRGVAAAPIGEAWTEEARDGAQVMVRSWSGRTRTVRTSEIDGEGRFEVQAVPPGSFRPALRTPLWADHREKELDVRSGETVELKIQLDRGSIVSGRVVDENELGKGGVAVELTSTGEEWAREFSLTEDDGSFMLRGVPEGEFQIKAAVEERLVAEQPLGFIAAGTKREGIVLEVRSGYSVQGFVRWPDGSPAVGASVSISQDREVSGLTFNFDDSTYEKTGPDGSFEVFGLENSESEVRASAKSFRPADIAKDKQRVKGGKDSRLRARGPTYRVRKLDVAAGTRGLILVLDPGDSINGRVVDDLGEGLAAFLIQARPTGGDPLRDKDTVRRMVLSVDGSFSVDGLRPGDWSVRAIADDHEPSQEVSVTLPGSGELEFVANRLAQVSGLVRDPNGKPFSGAGVWVDKLGDNEDFLANVMARSWGEQTRTNRDGEFKASDITPGRLRVWASADGFGTSEAQLVTVDPGTQVEQVLLQLRQPGRIRGTLHGSILVRDGRKIEIDAVGEHRYYSEPLTTDRSGDFEATGLDAGTYRLKLQPPEQDGEQRLLERTVAQDVVVSEGGVSTVVLGSPPANPALVHGVITRGREPAPGVTVRCRAIKDGDVNSDVATTNEAGVYAMSLAGEGEYRFMIGDPESGVIQIDRSLADGKNDGVDFELPASAISGTVFGLSGEGMSDCDLRLLPVSVEGEGPAAASQWVKSSEGGRFSFAHVAPGTYNLRVHDRNFSSWRRRRNRTQPGTVVVEGLRVVDGKALTGLEIQLVEAGRVKGTVTGPSGQPISGAFVLVQTPSGENLNSSRRTSTDALGKFECTGIGMERVTLVAQKGDEAGKSVAVRVIAGEESEVQLILDAD